VILEIEGSDMKVEGKVKGFEGKVKGCDSYPTPSYYIISNNIKLNFILTSTQNQLRF
jgi:hypothetical protein